MGMNIPKPVTADQFTIVGDRTTHLPHFVTFVLTARGVVCANWGLTGITPGAEFDPAEVKSVAAELLQTEKQSSL